MRKNIYQKFYDIEETNWWFKGMHDLLLDLISANLKFHVKSKLLDIGCGTGLWPKYLSRFGNVYCLDNSREAIKFCAARNLNKLIVGQAEELPYKDECFDFVSAIGVVEHLDDDQLLLREINRILKPGGYMVLLTSAFDFLWSAHDDLVHHKKRYRKKTIETLLIQAELESLKISYVNSILFPGIAGIRIIQKLINWIPAKNDVTKIFTVSEFLNNLLFKILRLESSLLKHMCFPFGVGIVALAQKKIVSSG